jgi:PEP-CTERM motif
MSAVLPGSTVFFFSLADLGLFDIGFDFAGNTFLVQFFGPQLYSGTSAPFTLLTGTFLATSGDVIENDAETSTLSSGKVIAPEPATLALLGFGIVGIGALRRKKAEA